jgi:hypothetical protein
MSFGTEFNADIYISRKMFTSIAEVQDYRDELKEEIVHYKSKLLMYVVSNPKDIIPDKWNEEPIRWLQDESLEILGVIEDNLNLLFKIDHLLEYLKENNIETIKN